MCIYMYTAISLCSTLLRLAEICSWFCSRISSKHRIDMFYSHQLLARKAPLGQIWRAATLHAKIHRKKLDKLNIIKICEEILNPSVPMALRLSGILMGGVVIVYERKVKLLLDDVNRLLLEINEAWKVKDAPSDSAGPRKTKTQANYESITYPQNFDGDLGEAELSIPNSNANTFMDFQRTSHIAMRLDSVGDPYLSLNPQENLNHDYHQADVADITLCDNYELNRADSTMFERFERFDIEGDEETLFASENIDIPRSCIPTPPQGTKSDELQDLRHGEQFELPYNDRNEAKQEDAIRQRPGQRRARRPKAVVIDYDQTMIPGPTYQSWLVDPSDIVSREGRNRKRRSGLQSTMKIAEFMRIPSVVPVDNLFKTGNSEIYFPSSLLELFVKSSQRSDDSPCGRTLDRMPLNLPSSSSPPDRVHFMEPTEDLFEAFQSKFESLSKKVSIEKQRANADGDKMPPDIFMDVRDVNGVNASNTNLMMTPAHSGDEIRSIPSSGSDRGLISQNSEANSGRSSKKRHISDSKNSGNGLEPLAEDLSWHHPEPSFKLSRQSEHGLTPDLLVETGPTQTQKQPISDQSLDRVTDSMRMYLKDHFDTPGSAKQESLNKLTIGMNRKKAASLFYQTTVLATRGHINVKQMVAYGDILISRGANM